jgi:hypothetical protein
MTMTVTIPLSPAVHARLEAQARASGTDIATCITQTLDALLPETLPDGEDRKELLSRFDAWASRRQSHNPNFDDSRESIYPNGNG